MVLQMRQQRWPSEWETYVEFRDIGKYRILIRNVSHTGIRFRCDITVPVGTQARLTVMDTRVYGKVLRCYSNVSALAFSQELTTKQLASLRQYRRLGPGGIG